MTNRISIFGFTTTIDAIRKHYMQCSINDEEFLREYANFIDINKISQFLSLSEEFIIDHISTLNFETISKFSLSESFIDRYNNELNWSLLSIYSDLSIECMMKYSNRLKWEQISYYQTITLDFFKLYEHKLNLSKIIKSPFCNEEIKKYIKENCKWDK